MWTYHNFGPNAFQQELVTPENRLFMGKSFYTCNYLCPECGEHLFKSNVLAEYKGKIGIETDKGMQPFSSVFYCPECQKLYSVGGLKGAYGLPMLSDGHCFVLDEESEVKKIAYLVDENYAARTA